jgi:hypothetical protein
MMEKGEKPTLCAKRSPRVFENNPIILRKRVLVTTGTLWIIGTLWIPGHRFKLWIVGAELICNSAKTW